jgi:predicted small lipoprotein YifL
MSSARHAALLALSVLAGCGLYVPDKDPFSDDTPNQTTLQSSQGAYENEIVLHVTCEIEHALYDAQTNLKIPWLETWGTTVTLTITAQEQGGVNPGVTLIQPLENSVRTFPTGGPVNSPQSISLGAGVSGSANSTRTETIQFTNVNRDLMAYAKKYPSSCDDHRVGLHVMINGDLKIRQFIYDKLLVAKFGNANSVLHQYDEKGDYCDNDICYDKYDKLIGHCDGHGIIVDSHGKPVGGSTGEKCLKRVRDSSGWPLYDTFTEEITFVASVGGNITPTWKFATSVFNPNPNFISAQRVYTNDLIITIGPMQAWPAPNEPAKLDNTAQNQHNARVNANAIATATQGQ